jgi:glycosyltransferase involved in cell wall biosynthesis
MLSVIIATDQSERAVVPTLAALVPGATAGLVADVIFADIGSSDATAEVADHAGCRLIVERGPLGARYAAAARSARADWLLFLTAGTVPQPGWVEAVQDVIARATAAGRSDEVAATFPPVEPAAPPLRAAARLLLRSLGLARTDALGLLIGRRHYARLGGHPPIEAAEHALRRRIARRRLLLLGCGASRSDTPTVRS